MMAPAMMDDSFHHSVPSPRLGIIKYETMKVRMMDRMDVIHTRWRFWRIRFGSALPSLALAMIP